MGDDKEQFRDDLKRLWESLCTAGSQAWDCRDTARRLGDRTEKDYAALAELINDYTTAVKGHAKSLGVQFEE